MGWIYINGERVHTSCLAFAADIPTFEYVSADISGVVPSISVEMPQLRENVAHKGYIPCPQPRKRKRYVS